jgi:hypothetical protein
MQLDENREPLDDLPPEDSATKSRESYIRQAIEHEQPRFLDLLPTRPLAIAVAYLAGIGGAIGLLALASYHAPADGVATSVWAKLLDASSPTSLLNWLATTLWLCVAVGSYTVFSLRKHRIDDYRAHYRVWLIALIASILCSSNQISGWSAAVPSLASTWWPSAGPTISFVTAAVVLGGLMLRMAFEVRHSTLALMAITFATVFFAAPQSALVRGNLGTLAETQPGLLILGGTLIGQLMLLLGISLYARHILLEATGVIRPKQRKTTRKVAAKSSIAPSQASDSAVHERPKLRTDLAPPAVASRTEVKGSHYEADSDEDEDDENSAEFGGLSRAERKKLKRQQRQSNRKGAA